MLSCSCVLGILRSMNVVYFLFPGSISLGQQRRRRKTNGRLFGMVTHQQQPNSRGSERSMCSQSSSGKNIHPALVHSPFIHYIPDPVQIHVELVSSSSNQWVRGMVHPGQTASQSTGHIETNNHSLSHLGSDWGSQLSYHAHFWDYGRIHFILLKNKIKSRRDPALAKMVH